MFQSFQRWFTVPEFQGDEIKKLKAKLLNVIVLTFLIAAGLYALFAPIDSSLLIRRFFFVVPFILFMLFIRSALFRGHIHFVSHAVVISVWLLITAAMGFGAGYKNPAFLGYLVVVVCAGLVLGRRAAIAWSLICILTSGLVVTAAEQGLLTVNVGEISGGIYWTTQSTVIVVITVLLNLALSSLDNALSKAAQELDERKRAEMREFRRSELLAKVIQLGKSVTEVTQLETTLYRIWEGVRTNLDFDRVGLFLYDPAQNWMEGAYGTDRDGNFIEAWDVRFDLHPDSLFYSVLNSPNSLYYTENLEEARNISGEDQMHGVRHYAAVAAWSGNKPVAIIAVDQLLSGREIKEEQLEALRLFAGYAGLAIENARLNQDLEQRVEERTHQLEIANRDLEAFSYSVSHDLRAPLRAVNGFATVLQDEYAAELDEMGRGFVTRILENTNRMAELINDLLSFSKFGRQALHKQPLEPGPIAQEVWDELIAQTDHRRVHFTLRELPSCQADPILLRQVFSNLLENALKYSSPREIAQIEVGWKNGAYFVSDNGVGFNMAYAGKLFNVFQRLHRVDEFEGTGVGLATVHRIIERHGGKIWCEAEEDKGATFFFTLQPQAE